VERGKDKVFRRNAVDNKPMCANCFVCKQDTELCPLNENYSPDAYKDWEERYLRRRKERKWPSNG